mgnify:CR=1 FL=1
MDTSVDEYFGNITFENITRENISAYIRKDGDNFGCLLDCLSLILLRPKNECIEVQKAIANRMYSVDFRQFKEDINMPALALQCSELLDALLMLPGREALFRLYRYVDVLIYYLDASPLLASKVNLTKEVRDNEISTLVRQKRPRFDGKSEKIRKLNKICREKIEYLNAISSVEQVFNDREKFGVRNADFHALKKQFYDEVYAIDLCLESSSEDTELCPQKVNAERKNEALRHKERAANKRRRGLNEVTWTSLISSLGFENRWRERLECGKLGAKYKQSVGDNKEVDLNSNENKYVYHEKDRQAMEEIVRHVYRSK